MNSGEWGVVTVAWRLDGAWRSEGLVRWNIQLGTAPQMPPLQVQGIPGEYLNYYNDLLFTRDGAWYVTQGWEDNPPGVVFYAPFTTGVFGEVARFVPQGSGHLIPIPYPDGLVVGQLGTRWVRVITPSGGLALEQELPPIPIPDAWEGPDWRSTIQPMFVVYSPDSGRIGLAIGAFAKTDSPPGGGADLWFEGVCFTDLVQPGSPMTVSGDLYMTHINVFGSGDPVSSGLLVAAAPGIYGERTILSVEPGGRSRWWGFDWIQSLSKADAEGNLVGYMFISGDEASGHIPVKSVALGGKVVETGTDVWPGTSTVGRVFLPVGLGDVVEIDAPNALYDLPGSSRGYGLRPMWTPLPSTPPFWTAFNRTIEVIGAGESLPPQPDPDPDPSDGIVMLAGAHATLPGIGYAPALGMGGVDSDTLQVGGQTGTLLLLLYAYEESELVMAVDNLNGITSITLRIDGGEALTLSPTPDYTVWTAALAESPFVDGQSYHIDLQVELEGESQPDPDPGPELGDQYADFELGAGTLSNQWQDAVGFVVGQAGSLQPEDPVIGGISGYVYSIAYDVGRGALMVDVDDIFGASGATLTVGGVGDFVLNVGDSEFGFSGVLFTPDSPFVDGETYSVRLYLEGDLWGTAEDPDPEDGYTVDLSMTAGLGAPEWPIIGYTNAWTGSINPTEITVGGLVGVMASVAYGDGALFVRVDDIWGIDAWSLSISGGDPIPISVEPSPWGVFGEAVMAESPFVAGQTYDVRLYLEGDLRSEP